METKRSQSCHDKDISEKYGDMTSNDSLVSCFWEVLERRNKVQEEERRE